MERSLGDTLAGAAELLLKEAKQTEFSREPNVDPKTGKYFVDDAGFITLILERSAPGTSARIPKDSPLSFPSAIELYKYFASRSHPGFERIQKLGDARRGDIIAWTSKNASGAGIGHVAVLVSTPQFDDAAHIWTVLVHDSSAEPHFDDSRQRGKHFHAGLGSGALKLWADAKNAPSAVQAGPHSGVHKRQIVIGRITNSARSPTIAPKSPSQTIPEFGHRIERAPVGNEVLGKGEFALATYALASRDGMLLAPAALTCWGPGQKVLQSLGGGATTYNLIGGVVFRELRHGSAPRKT